MQSGYFYSRFPSFRFAKISCFLMWPVIKENTAHVVAACQNNVMLLLWPIISVKLNLVRK